MSVYNYAYPIAPSDTANVTTGVVSAIYVGTPGNVVVQMARSAGESNTTPSANVSFVVPQAMILSIRVNKVLFTGTSASNIVGLL